MPSKKPKLSLNIKLPNHLEKHFPTFEALTPTVALTATQTKKARQTANSNISAVTLVPGKTEPQPATGVKAKDQEHLKAIIPTHTPIRSHRLRRLVS
jgi:hypothetical protein